MNIKQKAKEIKTYIPALIIALKRKDTPLIAKLLAGITVAYALSPIDILPDFIPVLGYLDDLILLPLLAALTIKLIPNDIMRECKGEAEGMWNNGKPKRWYYAIPVALFWILVVGWIVSRFFF